MNPMPNQREITCANAFIAWLSDQGEPVNSNAIEWVKRGEDPPDCFIQTKRCRFAVEITSTKVLHPVSIGNGKVIKETYHANNQQFLRRLEMQAKEAGILSGWYLLTFRAPLAEEGLAAIQAEVKRQVFLGLQTDHDKGDLRLRYGRRWIASLQKIANAPDRLQGTFSETAYPESPEIVNAAHAMLASAIQNKKIKLENQSKTNPTLSELPKILLLMNTNPWADGGLYQQCISTISEKSYFYAVLSVSKTQGCTLLYTKDSEWISDN
jgi:hypothetical protein